MHTGDPKNYLLQRSKHINDKEAWGRVNQYTVKHKDNKRVEISEESLDTPPQRPTFLKTNHINVNINENEEPDDEEETQVGNYDYL